MLPKADDYRRYFHPATLSRIASLELRARTVVEGYLAGMHRSPSAGASVEFAQHRAYAQGDDLRHLDWKVFGRTDKLYVKQYAQETNLNCVLAVDTSESMAYVGTRTASQDTDGDWSGWTKYEYASTLAASLAFLALRQGDAVGLALFDESTRKWIRPSTQGAGWTAIVQGLHDAVGPRRTRLQSALSDLAGRIERCSLIVLVSDLLDEPDGTLRALRQLRYRGHDLIVIHVLDADEVNFPFQRQTLFSGLEMTGRMLVDTVALRQQYLSELRRFVTVLRRQCLGLHIDYALLSTDAPLDMALSRFLATRAASIRS